MWSSAGTCLTLRRHGGVPRWQALTRLAPPMHRPPPPRPTENFPNSDSGTCLGDSGGPLISPGTSAAGDRQIGITSWTGACGAPAAPSALGWLLFGCSGGGGGQGSRRCLLAARSHLVPSHQWAAVTRCSPYHACCPPGVFTDIGEVFPWIEDKVRQLTGDVLPSRWTPLPMPK